MNRSGKVIALGALMLLALVACSEPDFPSAQILFEGPALFPTSAEPAGVGTRLPAVPSHVSFTITVVPGRPIAPGGFIRIEQGRLFGEEPVIGADLRYAFPDPDPGAGGGPNRFSLRTGGSRFQVVLHDSGLGRRAAQALFPDGLPAGERVSFLYGDRSGGGPGMEVPVIPMKIRFFTFIDHEGDGDCSLTGGDHPLVESRVRGADRLRVVAPSTVEGGRCRVRIVPVRGGGGKAFSSLPVSDFSGEVEIRYEGRDEPVLGRAFLATGRPFGDVDVRLREEGVVRLEATCAARSLRGVSNPVLVDPERCGVPGGAMRGKRILWGSLQSHTAVGGHALGVPAEAFEIAAGPACLDFCALTDHSSNPSFRWDVLRALPDRYDRPGRFVALAGYEWTSEVHGHRHVILRDGAGTTAWSERESDRPAVGYAPTLDDLAREIGSDPNVLITVHHTTWRRDPGYPDYDFGRPGSLPRQRLFEVFSWHGSAEFEGSFFPVNGQASRERRPGSSLRDVLAAGRRFFITADSDGHVALPGIPVAVVRKRGMRYGFSGLTAVAASSFDRKGVFEALEEGRCYGTTGARILAFVVIGGGSPGEEIEADGPLRAAIRLHGTDLLSRVQIVRDGTDSVLDESPGTRDFERNLTLTGEPEEGVHSYYLRVEQRDGHRAWTSPVWIVRGSDREGR